MYPQMANTGGLIWENLRMPAYMRWRWAMTMRAKYTRDGIHDGSPWTELINRGYLVQNGSNSYRISEEGEAALASLNGPLLSRASLEAVTLLHPGLARGRP